MLYEKEFFLVNFIIFNKGIFGLQFQELTEGFCLCVHYYKYILAFGPVHYLEFICYIHSRQKVTLETLHMSLVLLLFVLIVKIREGK